MARLQRDHADVEDVVLFKFLPRARRNQANARVLESLNVSRAENMAP